MAKQWTMAGTAVTATVLGVGRDGRHSDVYRSAAETGPRLMSVNAGNSPGLWVGGGGINLAFGAAIDDPHTYGKFHTRLLGVAHSGEAMEAAFDAADPPLRCSYVRSGHGNPAFHGNDGTAFIDVFVSGHWPAGNATNAAMLYACPPDGSGTNYAGGESFLAAVGEMAAAIVEIVRQFNSRHAPVCGGRIPTLRMCAYSSAIYLHPDTTALVVVGTIYDGLVAGLNARGATDSGLSTIEFPYGVGFEAFAS